VISFRYHIVSIVGVFLALALGMVIGTTALNGTVTDGLRKDVNSLKAQRTNLNSQVKTLHTQVEQAEQFASTYGAALVGGTLAGKSVLLIALPGASTGDEDGLARQITAAGGKISGRVGLTADYVDARQADQIINLATGPNHPQFTLPETNDAGQLAGAMLAYPLVGKGSPTDLTTVLSGLSGLHMITTDGSDVAPADTVVLLGDGSLPKNDYGGAAELSLVQALQKDGGKVVVAGNARTATAGGIVALVRDAPVGTTVSTVDNADTAFGQVATVLTIAGAEKDQVGHYGTGSGADALYPSPAR
jgi:outer membrane murein-binding lipoprotein Lpp